MTLRLLTLGRQIVWVRPDPAFARATPSPPTHYGVGDDGLLRWYRLLDRNSPDYGGFPYWVRNSGNAIGNGWGSVTWMQLGDSGTLAAIHDDGGLFLYRYVGNGEEDPGGHLGWDVSSGIRIADGWDRFVHVAIALNHPNEVGLDDISFMAVDAAGDMYWYSFGTQSGHIGPSGPPFGEQPGSGRVIGTGWVGFEHIVVGSKTVLAATGSGALHWYRYQYSNHDFVKWVPQSGNQIGIGWNEMRHLVAVESALEDQPNLTLIPIIELTTVSASGEARRHSYAGTGEADPRGILGWEHNSGQDIAYDGIASDW